MVKNDKTGYLIDPLSESQIAKNIIYFLQNPNECSKMGKNARIKIGKDFNLEKEVEKLYDLIADEGK